ncbi:BsaWI family type II restriction enzyme [Campylobacter suis]|uniref:BsaWI restriction endonuclease type 2 domain-containing protein n=1 Tax=Campylobacter suis TaxID=2790657 RepID=A0ABM8Q0M3_9BACT|nr:BsaWI family type II restriction enzyme [Campylobacter suis]CAD7286350.1 hypothetical protein LMG8286_00181 [Campylobacter suis]
MKKVKLLENFKIFIKNEPNAINKLNDFFSAEKEKYYNENTRDLENAGISHDEAVIKTRQSWVTAIGGTLEEIVILYLQKFCDENSLKITNDKILKRANLNVELDEVKRKILVHFGEYSVLPDGDIIIYKFQKEIKILAILSVKNSFRERYTETPYWKLKLSQNPNTNHIKIYMLTPDNDDEISFVNSSRGIRKARVVMEYELDGIFLAKDDFDESDKVRNIAEIFSVLKSIL